ncbi:MAG: alkaline phosphatase family protein [Nanoarchaeota archaeon]
MLKGVLVILDGIGDLPNSQLKNKTPLDFAKTPNLDFFASRGKLGLMNPVKHGFVPESDEAVISIFGNDLISSTRGQLEAIGAGFKLNRGDLALRVNFGTIDSIEKGNILDRRAGRTLTTLESKQLAKALNKIKMPCKFEFKSTIQHRGALVFRGGFSDNFTGNDLTYIQGKSKKITKIVSCKPNFEDENTNYTINIVNDFLRKAYEVLNEHPINKKRREKGLAPANYLFVRGPGIEKPKLKQYRRWFSVAYMPLERGISEVSGIKSFSFDYPKLKGIDAYETLWKGLEKACRNSIKLIKKNYKKFDYVYIHLKETDLPGHDNKPVIKKEMIEYIDKNLFGFLRKFAPSKKINILVTADHSTPCKLKNHSADPVPVLFFDNSELEKKKFSEKQCKKGKLGLFNGKELLVKTGFTKK